MISTTSARRAPGFCGGESAARAVFEEAAARATEEKAFSEFLQPVLDELKRLYASPISREEKLRRREEIFARCKTEFLRRFPPPPGKTPYFVAQKLNNAVLLGYGVYHDDSPLHQKLFARVGGDLVRFIRVCKYAVENAPDPIRWLASR